MKLGELTFSNMLNICGTHICAECPLHRSYPIFYNSYIDEYEYCLIKTLNDKSVAHAVKDERIDI